MASLVTMFLAFGISRFCCCCYYCCCFYSLLLFWCLCCLTASHSNTKHAPFKQSERAIKPAKRACFLFRTREAFDHNRSIMPYSLQALVLCFMFLFRVPSSIFRAPASTLHTSTTIFFLFSTRIAPPPPPTQTRYRLSCANPRTLLVNLLEDIPDTWPILVVSTWETKSDEGEAGGPLGFDAGGAEAYGYRGGGGGAHGASSSPFVCRKALLVCFCACALWE